MERWGKMVVDADTLAAILGTTDIPDSMTADSAVRIEQDGQAVRAYHVHDGVAEVLSPEWTPTADMLDASGYAADLVEDDAASDAACVAERCDGCWIVRDAGGQRWWPSDETQAEIAASDDPAAEALRICREQPTRGEWRC
jgi:hypothetical protein